MTDKTNLTKYIGGQIEIQNDDEGYLYRGEIENIAIEGEGTQEYLKADLKWLAKWQNEEWVLDNRKAYMAGTLIYSISDIGNDRKSLYCQINGELAVLYPKGGSRLDPLKVKGLEAKLE
jgi:hypothetical protein